MQIKQLEMSKKFPSVSKLLAVFDPTKIRKFSTDLRFHAIDSPTVQTFWNCDQKNSNRKLLSSYFFSFNINYLFIYQAIRTFAYACKSLCLSPLRAKMLSFRIWMCVCVV